VGRLPAGYPELFQAAFFKVGRVDCSTHVNQFVFVPLIVLSALSAYMHYALVESKDVEEFVGLFESTGEEIQAINSKAVGDYFSLA